MHDWIFGWAVLTDMALHNLFSPWNRRKLNIAAESLGLRQKDETHRYSISIFYACTSLRMYNLSEISWKALWIITFWEQSSQIPRGFTGILSKNSLFDCCSNVVSKLFYCYILCCFSKQISERVQLRLATWGAYRTLCCIAFTLQNKKSLILIFSVDTDFHETFSST